MPKASSARASHQFRAFDQDAVLEIRTTLSSSAPYAEHLHSDFCIGAILAGQTRLSLGRERRIIAEGELVFIAPGKPHSCNPVEGQTRSYHMLHVQKQWFEAWCARELGQAAAYQVTRPVIRDPALFEALLDLVRAAESGAADVGRQLADLLGHAVRSHGCFAPLAKAKATPAADLLRAANGNEPENAPRVSALAGKAGLRRESFCRAVRRATGLSPSAYLHCLRLEKGRKLLRLGTNISEAALATGYADQSHFHRMFVRFYSVTPGAYSGRRSHLFKK